MLDNSKHKHKDIEERCSFLWEKNETHRWKGNVNKSFVIDTPPPTVSGALHMGHAFSYCHVDFIARYQRMAGRDVLFPIGFDDNGLPTERLVEKIRGIKASQVTRKEFRNACQEISCEFRKKFRELFKTLGISCDWTTEYHTSSDEIQKLSQASFIDLYEKGKLYRQQQPILWDVADCTAIAHAEIEERELPSTMNTISFHTEKGEKIDIATTRPEMIAACVAVFFNPEDARYTHLNEQLAVVPVGGHKVKILPDERVKIDKGTGLVMCCTFGDETDVYWWKRYKLDTRIIVSKTGCLTNLVGSESGATTPIQAPQFNGMSLKDARKAICEELARKGLLGAQNPISHVVKCAERSGTPLEILPSHQWFIKTTAYKSDLLTQVKKVQWYPKNMRKRLEIWIENLDWDWCISRQRYFGVPFPVWYSKRAGEEGKILLPRVDDLPINPAIDLPAGYSREEVVAEVDVMDTWATSSISPQFITKSIGQTLCDTRFHSLFPADLRTQSHEIIRSWAFYTILKSHHHNGDIPWKNIMISGWCLAEDRTKMSKSKGNAMEPEKALDLYGADAIRYWAAKSRLGTDTSLSEEVFKIGKRLSTKLWNASRFVSTFLHQEKLIPQIKDVVAPTDLWILSKLHRTVEVCTSSFALFEYCTALNNTETFFWEDFCDNYLELVKHRVYNREDPHYISAICTLHCVLKTLLLSFAPFLPYVTEEIYSTLFESSVHSEQWPSADSIPYDQTYEKYGYTMLSIVEQVRKAKTCAQVSMKHPVEVLTVNGLVAGFPKFMLEDVKHVCSAERLAISSEGNSLEVSTQLAPKNE